MSPDKLSVRVRKRLETPDTELFLSAATAWEIATKFRLGKLPSARAIVSDCDNAARRLDAQWLAITHAHAIKAGSYTQSHRDPFDRMLAAQAEIESVPLVSKDRTLQQFNIELVW